MHLFAYRTHAHSLGRVITGYRISIEGSFFGPFFNNFVTQLLAFILLFKFVCFDLDFIYGQTGKKEEIARGNPQWPQAFYGMSHVFDLESGDMIGARCTYDSTTKSTPTYMGKFLFYNSLYNENKLFTIT